MSEPGAASGPEVVDRTTRSPHRWWQALVLDPQRRPDRLLLVASERHPDGARVVLGADEVGALEDPVVCEARFAGDLVTHLHVSPTFAPKVPSVWFVELVADPPGAHDLLAFSGPGHGSGELVDGETLDSGTVTSADQLAAVRWWPETGELDQVYVQPAWRRRHLGSALVAAVACLNVARDRPRLWGDGERTVLGEALRNSRSWRDRTAALTHLAPPMTPGGASDG